ncbi:hypothetical protein [Lysinibacillus irui]|uniref:hypothetical protein n=1 Tax=Lysinibacillus irui TaxID=2998077 RepID=UPI002AD3EA68|nr:hypothetical protein [Lysinibacillus irui]MEA0565509.1 hypothetical protein [Lysinibacillus irui]
MMIDEKVTIGSIMNALKEGNKAEQIAKAIDGISQKPFLRALKDAGYVYSNKAPKGWRYVGEGEEPLDKSVFDYVKSSSPKVIRSNTEVNNSSHEVIQGNTDVNSSSPVVHPQFTRDELSDLMAMLHEWRSKKGTVQEPTQVHERIKALTKGDKTRKTIVIDEAIATQLDQYCERERVNKSDILHLALIDFFNNN